MNADTTGRTDRSGRTARGLAWRLVLVGVVVSVTLAGAATPVAAATLSVSSVNMPSSVTQGETFSVDVKFSGSNGVSEVTASLGLPSGLSCSRTSQTLSLDGNGEGTASFSGCTADAAGDYTGEVTVRGAADGVPDATKQAGLRVLSPAGLTLSTSLSTSSMTTDETATLTAVVHNTGDVKTGYSVSLTKPAAVDNTITAGTVSDDVAATSITTVEQELSAASAGDHSVTVTVTGENGQTLTETHTISVTEAGTTTTTTTTTSSGGGSGGGSGGAGGGGAASAPATSTPVPVPTPTLLVSTSGNADGSVTADGEKVSVEATGLGASDSLDLEVPAETVDDSVGDDGVALERMKTTFDREAAFEADVSWSATDDDAEASLPGAAGYVTVDTGTSFDEADVREVTFEFAVSRSLLDERSLAADEVALYRYSNGGWQELETTPVGTADGVARFSAVSPGLSTFAIAGDGAGAPDLSVSDVTLEAGSVEPGSALTVTARVSNDGGSEGTATLALTANGESVAEREVTVAAGETATVSFTPAFAEAGEYTLAVDGVDAGTVSVGANAGASDGDDAATGGSDASSGSDDPNDADDGGASSTGGDDGATGTTTPGFGVVVALAALLVAALAARVRD